MLAICIPSAGDSRSSNNSMASTQQKVDAAAKLVEASKEPPKEVSQEGFDYVLNAMNGEENMKEEMKDYKPEKTWTSWMFGSKKQ